MLFLSCKIWSPHRHWSHGLTTYKELCSLASDLNQPDLVYKFMNLANHHAMWNSRKVCGWCTPPHLPSLRLTAPPPLCPPRVQLLAST